MKRGDDFQAAKEAKTNIFRKELFQIFQNIKNIDIYATDEWGGDPCAFSFASLLSEIENEHWTQIKVKGVHDEPDEDTDEDTNDDDDDEDTDNKSWVGVLWSSSSKELKEEYQQKGYKLSFK
eukprot:861560_1